MLCDIQLTLLTHLLRVRRVTRDWVTVNMEEGCVGVGVFVFFLTSPLFPPIDANINSCNIRQIFLFLIKTVRYILVCKQVKFIVLRLSVLDLFTHMFISVFNPYVLVFDSVRYKILNLTYQNFHHFLFFFK